jgi:hypothetical protein
VEGGGIAGEHRPGTRGGERRCKQRRRPLGPQGTRPPSLRGGRQAYGSRRQQRAEAREDAGEQLMHGEEAAAAEMSVDELMDELLDELDAGSCRAEQVRESVCVMGAQANAGHAASRASSVPRAEGEGSGPVSNPLCARDEPLWGAQHGVGEPLAATVTTLVGAEVNGSKVACNGSTLEPAIQSPTEALPEDPLGVHPHVNVAGRSVAVHTLTGMRKPVSGRDAAAPLARVEGCGGTPDETAAPCGDEPVPGARGAHDAVASAPLPVFPQRAKARWTTSAGDRSAVFRVICELVAWYSSNSKPTHSDVTVAEANTAEQLKHHLIRLCPENAEELAGGSEEQQELWGRIELEKQRVHGHRELFVVITSRPQEHRLLVLHVPPKGMDAEQKKQHASRQATYHDDIFGNFTPGMRVKWDNWLQFLPEGSEEAAWVQQMQHGGLPIMMSSRPPRYHRQAGNYGSYTEHAEKGAAELKRCKARGAVEGPLHFRPWVVNPQGGVWQEEKAKWRTIYDLTKSGVNEVTLPLDCKYDMLNDMLPEQTPACKMHGWDLADAFFNIGREERFCDYLGLQDTKTGEFYRFRFALFGGSDCPSYQQHFSKVLAKVLDTAGASRGWSATKCTAVFMDDGHGVQPADLPQAEAEEQYAAMMAFMNDVLGVQDSAKKRELPNTKKAYIGFCVDSVEQTVSAEPKKVEKYTKQLEELKTQLAVEGNLPRLELASLVGKLQHTAEVVRGGQQLLREPYVARDEFVGDEDAADPWGKRTRVLVHSDAVQDMEAFCELLPTATRRYYLDGEHEENGFFRGVTTKTHEFMDEHSEAHAGIPVFTTDASGTAGGGHFRHARFAHSYPREFCAPAKSSNYREFETGLRGCKKFAADHGWEGERVLWRTDNTTSRSIVNKQGTMSSELAPISRELNALCRERDLDLAAMHIPGVDNVLADKLSRHEWSYDNSDWRLDEPIFWFIMEQLGFVCSLDGGADIVGSNSYLPEFCSLIESFFDRDLVGEDLYTNCDYAITTAYLRHFLGCYQRSPENTSGTFVLPVWTWAEFWALLRGARVILYLPARQQVYTSPDWDSAEQGAQPQGRAIRGATRWPVVVIHFPRAIDRRADAAQASGAGLRGGDADRDAGRRTAHMPRLSGDGHLDQALLRAMQPTLVSDVRRWWRMGGGVPNHLLRRVHRDRAGSRRVPEHGDHPAGERGAGADAARVLPPLHEGRDEGAAPSRHQVPDGVLAVGGGQAGAAAVETRSADVRGVGGAQEGAAPGHQLGRDIPVGDCCVAPAVRGSDPAVRPRPRDAQPGAAGPAAADGEGLQEAERGQAPPHGPAVPEHDVPRLRLHQDRRATSPPAHHVPGGGALPDQRGGEPPRPLHGHRAGRPAAHHLPQGLPGVDRREPEGGGRVGVQGQERGRDQPEEPVHPGQLHGHQHRQHPEALPAVGEAPIGVSPALVPHLAPAPRGGDADAGAARVQGEVLQRQPLHQRQLCGESRSGAGEPGAVQGGTRALRFGVAAQDLRGDPLRGRHHQGRHPGRRGLAQEGQGDRRRLLPHQGPPAVRHHACAADEAGAVRGAGAGHDRDGRVSTGAGDASSPHLGGRGRQRQRGRVRHLRVSRAKKRWIGGGAQQQ